MEYWKNSKLGEKKEREKGEFSSFSWSKKKGGGANEKGQRKE